MAGVMDEAFWEQYTLDELGELDWQYTPGADVAPGSGERESWSDIVLRGTLDTALKNLNPDVPHEYLAQAAAEVLAPTSQDAITENYRIHQILIDGYRGITYVDHEGRQQNPVIRFLSANPELNSYRAVNQVTIRSHERERRFDVVLYVNGMPLSIIELKAGSATATDETARDQLQTYLDEFPMAFRFAAVVLASDGVHARYGTPFTPWNHFAPWNVDEDGALVPRDATDPDGEPITELDLTLHGAFDHGRFDQILRDFIAFDDTADGLFKRVAKPHQYFAVTKAVGSTIAAVHSDGRAGVVWHTQGSGKSMEMELYVARVMRHERLANPTVVLITDRTELDTQLFDSFHASTLLPEEPRQIATREQLRTELAGRTTGGIYFTTLQKFGLSKAEREAGADHPLLSDRHNIIVIADEAHRSHYDNLDGYARHLRDALPHATLIAFTGTPIAEGERDTRRVFGNDIDVYDLNRAVADGATVPVFFEPRLIQLGRVDGLDDEDIDDAAEELTIGLDQADRDRIEQSVAVLETIYGAPERLKKLAADFVEHWERRRDAMQPMMDVPGKAMIVTATRSIAARLYDEIIALRPDWHSDKDAEGKIKVVYTGSASDSAEIRKHVRRPSANATIKNRVKEPKDELEIVIVKDMMLTGFDAPALHTLYLDRQLKGALLMQTLARVNRTFEDKDAGLLVAYAPLIDNLTKALKEFTRDADPDDPDVGRRDRAEAEELVHELLGKIRPLIAVDWKAVANRDQRRGWLDATLRVTNFLLSPQTDGNIDPEDPEARPIADSFRNLSSKLVRAWALATGSDDLEKVRTEVRFYEEVKTRLAKIDAADRIAKGQPIPAEIRRQLGDLIVGSAESVGVVDIYRQAGIDLPRLDALSDSWAEENVKPGRAHLAIEALRASILDEARHATAGNDIRQKLFSERVAELMTKYTNKQLTAAEVIAEFIDLAKEVSAESHRGEQFTPALGYDELALYDTLAQNPSAMDVMGTDVLGQIARALVETMRRDIRTDWTVRDDVKAKLRSSIRRLLRKYKYPPDQQPQAITDVMDRMEQMAPRYAEEMEEGQ